MSQQELLNEILEDMDIPSQRRDTSKPENVAWLLLNLQIRNRGHEGFSAALSILRKMRRENVRDY